MVLSENDLMQGHLSGTHAVTVSEKHCNGLSAIAFQTRRIRWHLLLAGNVGAQHAVT